MQRRIIYSLALVVSLVSGCDKDDSNNDGHNDDTTTSSTKTDTTTTTTDTTETTSDTTTATTPEQCDIPCQVLAQDCPEEQHCVPFICDPAVNGSAWDSTVCVPVGGKAEGEECKNPWEGPIEETCGDGMMCWNGVCKSQCTGTVASPKCASPTQTCLLGNEGALTVCMDRCDPFSSDCSELEACIPAGIGSDAHGFACIGVATDGTLPTRGEPCLYLNECAPGLYCSILLGPGAVDAAGCGETAEAGCCTPYCDLDDEEFLCPGELEKCVPVLDVPDPGFENVGWCIIPRE